MRRTIPLLAVLSVAGLLLWGAWTSSGPVVPTPEAGPGPGAEVAREQSPPDPSPPRLAGQVEDREPEPSASGPPPPTRRIQGRVRTAALEPIAGATVWIAAPRNRPRDLPISLFVSMLSTVEGALRLARTDGEGAFEISPAPPGRLVLGALAEGYAQGEGIVPDDGVERSLELLLGPEQVLEGEVVDAGGRGVAGARLVAMPRAIGQGENLFTQVAVETRSDAFGRFVLRAHPRGHDAALHVSADGFVSRVVEAARVFLEEEGLHRIALRAARDLTVRVVELESGRPVEGAMVVVEGFEPQAWGTWVGRAWTNREGIARVPASLTDRSTLRVLHDRYAPHGRSLASDPLEEPWEAEVWLTRPAALSGRVVDGAGRPVSGAYVAHHGTGSETVVTGEDGRWRFVNLPPGAGALVEARHRDHLPASSGPHAVVEGEDREVPDLVLPRGVRLVVEVLGADGGPRQDALVGLGDHPTLAAAHLTDAGGRADLGPQAPGYVVVSVSLEGHRAEARRVLLDGEGTLHVEPFRLRAGTDDD